MPGYVAIEDCGLDACQSVGSAQTDGRALVCLYLAQELSRAGYTVDLFTPGPRKIHPYWAEHIHVRNVADSQFPDQAEDGTDYDFVLVNHWSVAGRLGNRPVVYQPHEIESLRIYRTGQQGPEALEQQRHLLRHCAAVLVPSIEIRNYVVENLSVPVQRVILAPHGIDSSLFSPGDQRSARLSLNMDPSARVVLYVGQIELRKGLGVLRAAFDQLPSDVQLVVIGDVGEHRDPQDLLIQKELVDWKQANGYGDRLHMRGAVPWFNLPEHYRAADVVVLPSLMEPYGLPTVEALASGIPVVGSDIDGFREVMRHTMDGVLCRVGDARAFAEAIEQVLEGTDWHTESAKRERAHRASAFGWHCSTSAILEALTMAVPVY